LPELTRPRMILMHSSLHALATPRVGASIDIAFAVLSGKS
jgi:hypothetical protein